MAGIKKQHESEIHELEKKLAAAHQAAAAEKQEARKTAQLAADGAAKLLEASRQELRLQICAQAESKSREDKAQSELEELRGSHASLLKA